MAIDVPFVKMNGAGNAIVVADMRDREDRITAAAARALAGPGAVPYDQLMEVVTPKSPGADAGLIIFNCDGDEAQACGNGTRCVADWLHRRDGRDAYTFRTRAGLVSATHNADSITVDMGRPRFGWAEIPLAEEFHDTTGFELQIGPVDAPVLHTPSAVSMGNPHAIFWADEDLDSYDLGRFGPLLENHPIFPEGANITVARVLAPDHIAIRTWERGAGLTLACGSAACATLAAAARKKLAARKARITPPSGIDLQIEWAESGHILMTGPVEVEFAGRMDAATGAFELDPAA